MAMADQNFQNASDQIIEVTSSPDISVVDEHANDDHPVLLVPQIPLNEVNIQRESVIVVQMPSTSASSDAVVNSNPDILQQFSASIILNQGDNNTSDEQNHPPSPVIRRIRRRQRGSVKKSLNVLRFCQHSEL